MSCRDYSAFFILFSCAFNCLVIMGVILVSFFVCTKTVFCSHGCLPDKDLEGQNSASTKILGAGKFQCVATSPLPLQDVFCTELLLDVHTFHLLPHKPNGEPCGCSFIWMVQKHN